MPDLPEPCDPASLRLDLAERDATIRAMDAELQTEIRNAQFEADRANAALEQVAIEQRYRDQMTAACLEKDAEIEILSIEAAASRLHVCLSEPSRRKLREARKVLEQFMSVTDHRGERADNCGACRAFIAGQAALAALSDTKEPKLDPCWSCDCSCHQAGQNLRCDRCATRIATPDTEKPKSSSESKVICPQCGCGQETLNDIRPGCHCVCHA